MSDKHNILIIMSDQHARGVTGCYGNDIVRTPNIDRLAAEGMRFTNAYTPAPLCVPCRGSFMTSRTPSRNRVWENLHILAHNIPTWPHHLAAAGYETSLIGRMHFMGTEQRYGFENRPIGEYFDKNSYEKKPHHGALAQSRYVVETTGKGETIYTWREEQTADAACEYLTQHANASSDDRPFAATVGLWLPHCPYVAPKELFDYYYDRVDIPPVEQAQPETITRFREHRGITDITEDEIRAARAGYFALTEFMDMQVGKILKTLQETKLDKNTLVIYCSDHGDLAGNHGCWWKSNYYEDSAGVPLIARLPDVIAPGSTQQAVCNLMDIGPTCVDVAGAKPMRDVDGRSLWPTLQGNHPEDWVDETFSEFCEFKYTGDSNFPSRMIRSGQWKLWAYGDEANLPPALYNLEDDPGELNDLAGNKKYAAIRDQLLEKLHANWDPKLVQTQAQQQREDFFTLNKWHGALGYPNIDKDLAVPPGLEDGIEWV